VLFFSRFLIERDDASLFCIMRAFTVEIKSEDFSFVNCLHIFYR